VSFKTSFIYLAICKALPGRRVAFEELDDELHGSLRAEINGINLAQPLDNCSELWYDTGGI